MKSFPIVAKPKHLELQVPKNLDWELIKSLECTYQYEFWTTWKWGQRLRRVIWFLPAFFWLCAFSSILTYLYPTQFTVVSSLHWIGVSLIWTFLALFWAVLIDQSFDLVERAYAGAKVIARRASKRYRFWEAISLAVASAHLNEALEKSEKIIGFTAQALTDVHSHERNREHP